MMMHLSTCKDETCLGCQEADQEVLRAVGHVLTLTPEQQKIVARILSSHVEDTQGSDTPVTRPIDAVQLPDAVVVTIHKTPKVVGFCGVDGDNGYYGTPASGIQVSVPLTNGLKS